jgi:hypothetical protein
MTQTAFSKITAALIAVLEADQPVAEMIYRARSRAVPEKVMTAISVQFLGAAPAPAAINGAPIDWTSKYTIECLARSKTDSGDEAIDPLLLGVFNRLSADTTLGGLVDNVGAPTIEADYSAEGERTGWVCLTYQIEHRTGNLTLE